RMTTRIAASRCRSRTARRSSSSVCAFSALRTFGRLIVMAAIAPSRSRTRVSNVIGSSPPLQRERIHQPAEDDRRREEAAEHHPAEPQLLARIVLRDDGEDERDEEGEQ